MRLRVLTWNLMHGRSVPGAGRELLDEFGTALAGWEWDVALLQEVPPWWPSLLAARLGPGLRAYSALTSRNWAPPARRALARRWPDLMRSNGGGANAILVRDIAVVEVRRLRLRVIPERRWLHAVRLEGGAWVGNLHAGGSMREALRAAQALAAWAGGRPALLGGDFNLHSLSLPGFLHAGGHEPDHVFVRGLSASAPARVLDHGRLSDHAPVLVELGGDSPSRELGGP